MSDTLSNDSVNALFLYDTFMHRQVSPRTLSALKSNRFGPYRPNLVARTNSARGKSFKPFPNLCMSCAQFKNTLYVVQPSNEHGMQLCARMVYLAANVILSGMHTHAAP